MNDDRPVGGGMGSKAFSAAPEPEEDFSKLSLDQLLTHANWKARKEGYEKIMKDPKRCRGSFFDKLSKVSSEGNAAAQETLFEALVALVGVCDDDERGLLCEAPLSLAVEKGITGRPKAVAAVHEFASCLVENRRQNEVFGSLLPAFTHKTPKNRQAAAQLCVKLVGDFGTQHLPIKPILKAMQPLFNDANPQVRKEAVALCCQCYKFIGAGIKGFLTDLRDVQLQELEKQFESVTLGGTPPKKIKGTGGGADGRRGSTTAAPQAIGSLTGEGGTGEIDDAAFDMLDESPVISKLPKRFFPTALDRETSWQARCEYVTNTLMPLLSAPRLRASEDYHELASMVKAYLTDPQAPLMLLGFQMIQECARGLRGRFANCAKIYISPLFDKMKDKKTSVLLHISATLEKLIRFHCITLDQCNEEMEQVSQGKNPSQRIALITFCCRMVDQLDRTQYQRLGRSVNMLKRMVNDEKSENRDAGYVLLGKLVEAFGEAQYKGVFASMDDKQKARMQIVLSAPEKQHGLSAYGNGAPTPKNTMTTPSNSPAKKLPRVEELSSARSETAGSAPVSTPAGSAVAARRVSSSHGPRSTVGSGAGPSGSGSARSSTQHPRGTGNMGRSTTHNLSVRPGVPVAPSLDDPVSLESTMPPRMEASTQMLGLLNGDTSVIDLLRSHEWSQRLDGMLKVKSTTDQWSAAESTKHFNTLAIVLRYIPGFKESNFQVFQAALNVLNDTLSKTTSLSPGAGYVVVAGCTPRLTDMKNRQPVRDICSRIGQRLGYRFVIHHMILVAKEVKTPKLMQECNEYFTEVVEKCAAANRANAERAPENHLDVRGMMDYIRRPCFEQTAPPVRTATMQLLLALNRYDTIGVRQWIKTFPPQVVSQFEQQATAHADGGEPASGGRAGGEPPLLPRPRPSLLSSTTRPSTAIGRSAAESGGGNTGESVQKRYRASSHSPGPGARARGSVGGAGGPSTPSRASQRVRSSSIRASGTLGAGSGSATNRTPLERSFDASTPSASEVPSVLRSIIREITAGQDWRDRLDAVRRVDEYMDSNSGTVPASTVAPLLKALGTRFDEANKNFVVDVLRTILHVVEGSEPEESRAPLRRLMPGALAMLGDQKTMLREEARKVVFLGMDVCGLDTLLQALQRPLGSDSNIARQNTLEAMVHGFENQRPDSPPVSRAGLQLLVPSVVKALMDRIQEVRLAAEEVIGYFLPVMGEEPILRHVQLLKPAEQQAVMPAIERQVSMHTPANTSTALIGPPAGGNEEEEDLEGEDSSPAQGRRAGRLTPLQLRSPTPVGTPRRASHRTPRRASHTAHSRGGSFTPRTASLASHATASHTNAVNSSDNSHSNVTLPLPSSQAPLHGASTPTKSSARRPSLVAPPSQQPPSSAESRGVPHAGSATAVSTPSASARDRKEASAPLSATLAATAPAAVTPAAERPQCSRAPVDKERRVAEAAGEQMYSITEIQIGLRSATPRAAHNMCTDFMKHLRAGEDCGTPEMMQVMVERLHENSHKLEPELALALIGCLSAMYASARSAQRCHSNLIFRLVGTIFDCLLSEQFSLNESVLKSLNNMTLKMLEGCPANDVFSALISRMTSYSTTYLQTGRKGDLKYIQVTVKCVMRVDLEQVSADNVILCCHEYLLQHPPSAFLNLDDLPIRTVKTILQTITRRYGQELLTTADRLVGPQNLVTHFIRACLERRDRESHAPSSNAATAVPTQRENNEKHAAEESFQQQRASQSPAPKATPVRTATPVCASAGNGARGASPAARTATHTDPNAAAAPTSATPSGVYVLSKQPPPQPEKKKASPQPKAAPSPTPTPTPTPNAAAQPLNMADIFTHIRHHTTSQQGIDELYALLKEAPASFEEDFNHQFLRCSEAFRLYIRRKLDRRVAEDPAVPPTFTLPTMLASVPL